MKFLLSGLLALVSITAYAGPLYNTTEIYDLYDDSGEKQPHWIEIESNSAKEIVSLRLYAAAKTSNLLLLNFDSKKIAKHLKISLQGTELDITTENKFKSTYQGRYMNYYGDAYIEKGHEYNMGINLSNGCPVYLDDEYEKCRLEIGDLNVAEMAMWGTLVKRK